MSNRDGINWLILDGDLEDSMKESKILSEILEHLQLEDSKREEHQRCITLMASSGVGKVSSY